MTSKDAPPAVPLTRPPVTTLSLGWSLVVGGMASCTAEAASFPFDVIKTRQQVAGTEAHAAALQAQAAGLKSPPPTRTVGIWKMLRTAVSTDGIRSLYWGIRPSLLRQATYGSMKVMLYDQLKIWICGVGRTPGPDGKPLSTPSFPCALLSGALAGAISQAICTPTDLIKVRMQTASRSYRGIWHAFTEVVRTERGGIRALWTGVWPTTQRATVVSLTTLPTYDLAKSYLLGDALDRWLSRFVTPSAAPSDSKPKRVLTDSVGVHLLASFSSGCVSSYASQPFDVLKSRVMNQPVDPVTGAGLWYRGTWHCAVTTVRTEGVAALWKGSVAQLARTAPWLVVFWLSYEQFKRAALSISNS